MNTPENQQPDNKPTDINEEVTVSEEDTSLNNAERLEVNEPEQEVAETTETLDKSTDEEVGDNESDEQKSEINTGKIEENDSGQAKAEDNKEAVGVDQQVQEVKAASKIIYSEAPEQDTSKKNKGVAAVVAGALLAVGLGGAFAATRGGSNESATKNPSSTSAEANPGASNEQESSQNILAGITVDKTLKEFDNKEYKNVMSLLEAKNFARNPLDTPAVNLAVQIDPNHEPIADYNVKIFGILLNGSSDEIKDLLQQLGLGPTELKEQYDKSIKLGTFNEWGDIEINTPSKKPWPSTQGSYTDTLDILSQSIMYNRVFAVSIANAVEVTGGDIPPAKPRDAETLKRNNDLITGSMGPVEDNLVAIDNQGDVTVKPDGKLNIPDENIIKSYDDLMIIYIDLDDPNLELQISETMPSFLEKAKNPAYVNKTGMPGNLTIFTKYPYQGPTTAFYSIPKKYL